MRPKPMSSPTGDCDLDVDDADFVLSYENAVPVAVPGS